MIMLLFKLQIINYYKNLIPRMVFSKSNNFLESGGIALSNLRDTL